MLIIGGVSITINKAEVILHPIRMRIIQALISGRRITAQQLQEHLGDVPQATLYRHLKKMIEANVLIVVDQIPNRGTLEKVYMLPEKGAEIPIEDIKQASSEDHLTYFTNYSVNIIGEYGRYLEGQDFDLYQDGVSYRQVSIHLSDEENLQMLRAIRDILNNAMLNEPNENRRRRLISLVNFPEA